MLKSFKQIMNAAVGRKRKKICVAAAHDEDILRVAIEAGRIGLGDAILVGSKEIILDIAKRKELDLSGIELIRAGNEAEAARIAVDIVAGGNADILMKGLLQTSNFLRAVLKKDSGLRGSGILSHVAVFEIPLYDRLLFMADSGLNISPDLKAKTAILENTVTAARALGVKVPKVAVLSAIEVINPDIPSSMDASILAAMAQRGQIKNCIVDGPLAMDNAISLGAARHKGIKSPVAGRPDILLMPNMETGNIFYKTLVFLAGAKSCGVVMGANAPIVLTSRSDTFEAKINSIAAAVAIN